MPPPEQDFDDNLEAAQAQLKRWWFRPDFSLVPFHEDAYIDDLLRQTTENERAFLCYRLFMAQWFWLWHYRRQLREMQAWRVCVDEALHGIGADSVKTEKLRHRIQVLEDTVEHERAERRHLELRMKKAEGLIADMLEKNRGPDLPRAIMDNIHDEKIAAAIAAAEKAIENDQHDPERTRHNTSAAAVGP